jgi:hypothetical protein
MLIGRSVRMFQKAAVWQYRKILVLRLTAVVMLDGSLAPAFPIGGLGGVLAATILQGSRCSVPGAGMLTRQNQRRALSRISRPGVMDMVTVPNCGSVTVAIRSAQIDHVQGIKRLAAELEAGTLG